MSDQAPPSDEMPSPAGPTARPEKRCRCGHDRRHPLVHSEPKYSFGGWLLLLFGATPTPTHAIYKCGRCQQVIGVTRDPKILKEFS